MSVLSFIKISESVPATMYVLIEGKVNINAQACRTIGFGATVVRQYGGALVALEWRQGK
jgi:hypothetical protein